MQITLYINNSENNTIGKTLAGALSLGECTMREDESLLNPVLRIATASNLAGYNYAYVPEFGRYYFITDIVAEVTGVWRVSLRVDVLESFKSAILANKAVIERQEKNYNLYFSDPEWAVYENQQIMTRDFPSGFSNSGTYYLTVAGGYYQESEV